MEHLRLVTEMIGTGSECDYKAIPQESRTQFTAFPLTSWTGKFLSGNSYDDLTKSFDLPSSVSQTLLDS